MANTELFQLEELQELSPKGKKQLERLYYHCNVKLGGTSIPVQLETDDYAFSFESALHMYRTRSSRSINQTFGFMELQKGQSIYTLHERVDVVKRILRGGGGFSGGLGSAGGFESFGAATTNTLLRGAAGGGGAIDLATWDMVAQYQKTLGRLFAREINFYYRNETNELVLHQTPNVNEHVLLELSVLKSISELMDDHWAYDWLQKYTFFASMEILGRKLGLFAIMPGPQGGSTTRAESMISEAQAGMEKLEDELMEWGDSSDIPMPIRG